MKNRFRFGVQLIFRIIFIAGLGVWISSCGKDNSTDSNNNGGTQKGEATVTGVVKDAGATGTPVIAGAEVQVVGDSSSVTTDANGVFSIGIAGAVNKTITVSKSGYSLNEVVVNIPKGGKKNITVSLLQSGATKSVATNSGGTVTDTKSNAVILLPANFVSATGNVSVTITGLDPTTQQIRALPGGLEAVDANGNAKYLQPVSFAEYTVKDANGNVLQFNQSASSGANIELPIPVSLRGKPGYKNGDPIECYVYDAADGKWKTPVPGIVGPSSVDGNPAIKATIFHLSWYGGAPASNQRACIKGYVKNLNGTPAAGADVEAYPGGTTTTNESGFFDVDAAPSSNVRIVATVVTGSLVSSAEVVVYTGTPIDSCYTSPDLTLGSPQQGNFEVTATLYKSSSGGQSSDIALATISLKTTNGASNNWDSADVKIGYGTQFTALPSLGSGTYMLYSGLPGSENFVLTPGEQYEIKIDFDKNGTIDANGFVRMVGVINITNPVDNGTVGRTFTASWTDDGATNPGYSANYWLTISGNTALFFLTTSRSKVIGDGSVDSTFYGYPQPNVPLSAGQYVMNMWSFNGPTGFLSSVGAQLPNINGQNVEGYFYSYYLGAPVTFNSTGTSALVASSFSRINRQKTIPIALRNFYKSIPTLIKKKSGISLPKY